MPIHLEEEQILHRIPMNVIFLLDTSASMQGERIARLNATMPALFGLMADAAQAEEIDVQVRVISFNMQATWVIGDKEHGVAAKDCKALWQDLEVMGLTNTAEAIDLAQSVMSPQYLGERAFYPLVILITDGCSCDTYELVAATKRLKASLGGTLSTQRERVRCLSIGVMNADVRELEEFASKGNVAHRDGSAQEDVPLVFLNEDLAKLDDLITNVTLSSIHASADFFLGEFTVWPWGDDASGGDDTSVGEDALWRDDTSGDQDISWDVWGSE